MGYYHTDKVVYRDLFEGEIIESYHQIWDNSASKWRLLDLEKESHLIGQKYIPNKITLIRKEFKKG